MKYTLFTLLLLLLLTNCDQRKEIKALQSETLTAHDEAMKEMAEMNRIGRNLKNDPAFKTEINIKNTRKDSILAVLHQIEIAEADMMDWMANYEEPAANMEKNAAIAYLADQKAKMVKNQQDIHAAVLEGKVFLVK
jgi:hypothetical protein